MQTSNPALNARIFQQTGSLAASQETMSIRGTVTKTSILLGLALVPAFVIWDIFFQTHNPAAIMPYTMIGVIAGAVLAFATIFVPRWAPITAPAYALAEGAALGGISAIFEDRYPGIVVPATIGTFGTLACMLAAYRSGLVRATEKFKLGVVAATGAIALVYLVTMVLGFFGVHALSIYQSGPIGIGFSVVVVVIAALNLVLDFDMVEQGAERGMPKYMEWYAAFGLMLTLVWLYLEILRLLAKLRDR
jgi:uncharacterized YccA/Bax inhibitor family protein